VQKVTSLDHDFWPIPSWTRFLHNADMKLDSKKFNNATYAALSGWIAVGFVSIYWAVAQELPTYTLLFVALLLCLYITCFLFLTACEPQLSNSNRIGALFFIQLATAYVLMLMLPLTILSILTIIWAAVLPFYYQLRSTLILLSVVILTWFALYTYRWNDEGFFLSGVIFGSLHLFAIFMSFQAKESEEARIEAVQLNNELRVAQGLLEQLTRQNERTRIARDLHDLLGHHLTALIINLQVAGHLTEGDAKNKVDQCHSMAKLLLSDVREAVSTLRENNDIDFNLMIELMVSRIPNLKVVVQIDLNLGLEDITLARDLLFCIQEAMTNSLRHSGADEFVISQTLEDEHLILTLSDNGQTDKVLAKGNGLLGIDERVQEHKGEVLIDTSTGSLKLKIVIPFNRKMLVR